MAFLFWPADDTVLPFMERLRRTLLILTDAMNMLNRRRSDSRFELTRTHLAAFIEKLMPATWASLGVPLYGQYADSGDDDSDIMGSDTEH